MADEILLTTLENIPASDVEQHYGIVSGNAVKSSGTLTSFIQGIRNFFGGVNHNLESLVEATRQQAIDNMVAEAKKLGGNAIVNVRFESVKVDGGTIEVYVYGTAIKMIKY
ncbi:MAG: YbjQ family protein [Rickettsiales bacterium]